MVQNGAFWLGLVWFGLNWGGWKGFLGLALLRGCLKRDVVSRVDLLLGAVYSPLI